MHLVGDYQSDSENDDTNSRPKKNDVVTSKIPLLMGFFRVRS